ncbi:MAG TPA: DinB family protein, partial [Thermoanaerobaculia bacterium]|nr:DinB family protein [Thermoanaerobaculia bacterium]
MNLDDTAALLARTPAALDALLRGLPEAWTSRNEGEGTWTAVDIVGHLIHGELTDWMPRTRHVLQFGDTRPFEPFDRLGFASDKRSLEDLLDEFARLRAVNLRELLALNLQPSDLDR